MIPADRGGEVPARPPSEVEWEDLLVRLDVAPRALRVAVDDAPTPGAALVRVLQLAVAREAWWGERIADLREGRPVPAMPSFAPVTPPEGTEPAQAARELCWAFETARRRNFAQVQRRGVEVWGWESPREEGGALSIHQALWQMARADVETLAMLRAAGRGREPA